MKSAKWIAVTALFLGVLIGGQFALSGILGVEIVTAVFSSFCFFYGIKKGLILAVAFSVLRCIIFGFFPTVIILYLIYYPLLAVVTGFIGNRANRTFSVKSFIFIIIAITVLTPVFSLLDDLITPLFYGFSKEAMNGYFLYSVPVIITQTVSAVISSIVLFPLIVKLLEKTKRD